MDVFVLIHESLAPYFVLLRDSRDGYMYRGTLLGKIPFRDMKKLKHHVLKLARPAILLNTDGKEIDVRVLLARPRYSEEGLDDLPALRTVVTNFSFSPSLNSRAGFSKVGSVTMEAIQREMVGIGIGEIRLDPPRKPFVQAPWGMKERFRSATGSTPSVEFDNGCSRNGRDRTK